MSETHPKRKQALIQNPHNPPTYTAASPSRVPLLIMPQPALLPPVALALALLSALAGCNTHSGSPDAAPRDDALADTNSLEPSSVRIDRIVLSSGLIIEDIESGAGEICLPDSWIRVRYTCRLPDATQVDSSGDQTLVLSLPRMIRGWQDGLPGMRVGGKRRLTVPPDLGYGSRPLRNARGIVVIPADSTLEYTIDLLGIVQPPLSTDDAPSTTSSPTPQN